jgi:hypothetical protein
VLCKIVDADGDIIVTGGSYTGLKNRFSFLEGTGKWKGITGDYESDQAAFLRDRPFHIPRLRPVEGTVRGSQVGPRHTRSDLLGSDRSPVIGAPAARPSRRLRGRRRQANRA